MINNLSTELNLELFRAVFLFFSSIIFLISYMILRKIQYDKKIYFIYIFSSLILSFVLFRFIDGLSIIFLLFILVKIDVLINKSNRLYSILTAALVLLNFFISDVLVNLFVKVFINKPLNLTLFIAYIILSNILAIILSLILSKLLNINSFKNDFNYKKLEFNKQLFPLLTILFSLLALSITFITYNILNVNDIRIYAVNLILFISYLICSMLMLYFNNKYSIKQTELLNNKMDMERLQEYTTNVENLYDNLRTFKHDYKNILLTLNHYIENKDIDSLEKYYKENILETGLLVDTKDYKVKLKNLKNIPIKSLILANIAKT